MLYNNIAHFIRKTCQIDARDMKLNKKRILSEIIAILPMWENVGKESKKKRKKWRTERKQGKEESVARKEEKRYRL